MPKDFVRYTRDLARADALSTTALTGDIGTKRSRTTRLALQINTTPSANSTCQTERHYRCRGATGKNALLKRTPIAGMMGNNTMSK